MERAERIDPGVPDEPVRIDLSVDHVVVVNDESCVSWGREEATVATGDGGWYWLNHGTEA